MICRIHSNMCASNYTMDLYYAVGFLSGNNRVAYIHTYIYKQILWWEEEGSGPGPGASGDRAHARFVETKGRGKGKPGGGNGNREKEAEQDFWPGFDY